MSLIKPTGITGLNAGHALNGKLRSFWELGQSNSDLVSSTSLTTSATSVSRAGLGDCLLFTSANAGFTETIGISTGDKIAYIFETDTTIASLTNPGIRVLGETDTFNRVSIEFTEFSSTRVEVEARMQGSSAGNQRWGYDVWANDGEFQAPQIHVVDFDPASAVTLEINGVAKTPALTGSPDATPFDTEPKPHAPVSFVEAGINFWLSAIVVFDSTATPAELDSFAADPWAMVSSGPALTATQTELTPGGTISGSYADFATVPTTLTVSDGTNTITIASPTISDNGDGTGTFSGAMPALPATGTANLVLFGNVTVELT